MKEEGSPKEQGQKAVLIVVTPTPEGLVALYTRLTGRDDLTPEEVEAWIAEAEPR